MGRVGFCLRSIIISTGSVSMVQSLLDGILDNMSGGATVVSEPTMGIEDWLPDMPVRR